VGVDGLTFDVIDPMISRGELPHFSWLAAEGASGPLATIAPTNSSLLWTSVATGRHHRDHGIDGFTFRRLLGMEISRTTVRRAKKFGLRRVLKALEKSGLMTTHTLDGRRIRTPTFWDIICEAGGRVGLVNWWNTWPADPINGFIVSDRTFHWRVAASTNWTQPEGQLTYPEELLEEVRELFVRPEQVTADDIARFVNLPETALREFVAEDFVRHDLPSEIAFLISLDRTSWTTFEYCLEKFPDVQLAAVYFRGPDIAQHCAYHYMPAAHRSDVTDEERRRYGGVVPQAYRVGDEMVGKVLGRMAPEDTVFVISDHGYGFQERRGTYGHARGQPPGVMYACGSEFVRGARIGQASIYDVAPTLLRVFGFPLAEDLEGRCLEEILTPEFRAEHPVPSPVPTYGSRRGRRDVPVRSPEVEEQIKEHLRGLGYLE
jgi:predicted AlkP superfamily phosphohydrolase/phosphomutase